MASNMKWIRLKIVNSNESSVEFVATCRIDGKAHNLHEVSRFVFEEGRWYYVDGEIEEQR
jgi:SEC-C motif-containing protein